MKTRHNKRQTFSSLALGLTLAALMLVASALPTSAGSMGSSDQLTVVGITASNRTYDGTTGAIILVEGAHLVGVPEGAEVALDATFAAATFGDKNAGTDKIVTITGLRLTGTDAEDFTLLEPPVTANVTARGLTVAGITASDKVYDSAAAAAINSQGAVLVGVVPGDDVNLVAADAVGGFSNPFPGLNKTVTIAGLTLSGLDAGNYTLTQPTTTADIFPAGLTVNGITANNKIYDGAAAAALNFGSATLSGVIGSEDVMLNSAAAAGTFNNKNVGDGKTVTISGLSLSGSDAGHYSLTAPAVSANVTAKRLTVTGITARNKVYDGSSAAILNTGGAALVGAVPGDTVNLVVANAVGSFANNNVAAGKTVSVSGLTLGGPDAGNYTLIQPTTTADITAPYDEGGSGAVNNPPPSAAPTPVPSPTPTSAPTTVPTPEPGPSSIPATMPPYMQIKAGDQIGLAAISQQGVVQSAVTVASSDRSIAITVLAGTIVLTGNTTPAIISITADAHPPTPPAAKNMGLSYECLPEETAFDPPIMVSWQYDPSDFPSGADENSLQAAYYDKTSGKWYTSESVVDMINHSVAVKVAHFSVYGLLAPAAAPPPVLTPTSTAAPAPAGLPAATPNINANSTLEAANTSGNSWLFIGLAIPIILIILLATLLVWRRKIIRNS